MLARSALLLAGVAGVLGQLTITSPSSQIWWIAKEQGNLAWTCQTTPSTETTWTVMLANANTQLLTDTDAVIAEQPNYDCSVLFTPQFPAGTGYTVLFVNPLNSSDVWATSEPFEIKPYGSTYASVASSASGASSTPTASAIGAGQSSAAGMGFGTGTTLGEKAVFGGAALLSGLLALL